MWSFRAIARWEKFRFNPPPSRQQLENLAVVVGVEVDRLFEMLPPGGVGMKLGLVMRNRLVAKLNDSLRRRRGVSVIS
ncbi:hypothetical protein [Calothrix sp. PCC 6303]|uniref:hypothetical protein n=1 Tax=Calothrix sp. PCC 6303 TaxID=1170562 RepID=UPI0002F85D25|nr:hypothetical protein [Calothrix sp. PCC 6303]